MAIIGMPLVTVALLPFDDAIGAPGAPAPAARAGRGRPGRRPVAPALTASAVAFVAADCSSSAHQHLAAHAVPVTGRTRRLRRRLVAGEPPRRPARPTHGAPRTGRAETEAPPRWPRARRPGCTRPRPSRRRAPAHAGPRRRRGAATIAARWRVDAAAGEPVPTTPADGAYSAELRRRNGARRRRATARGRRPSTPRRVRRPAPSHPADLALQVEPTRAAALAEANDLRDALRRRRPTICGARSPTSRPPPPAC